MCIDFLMVLQAACPGFIRKFMKSTTMFYSDLAAASAPGVAGDNSTDAMLSESPLPTDEDRALTSDFKSTNATVTSSADGIIRISKAAICMKPNKYWKMQHEVSYKL